MTFKDAALHSGFVPQQITARAAAVPEATAIVDRRRKVSYAELETRSRNLAATLARVGVGRDVPVAVVLDRSPEFAIATLAVLQSGGAYVPLDPASPRDRLAFMLDDADPAAILTDERTLTRVPRGKRRVLLVDGHATGTTPPARFESPAIGDNDLAYIIYTSGSTGRPKGVEIVHRGLVNLVQWHCRAFGVTSADRASQLASTGFDAAVWELWPYLTIGASVHIADEDARLDPERLRDWLLAEAITIGFVATPLAERLLSLPWPATTSLRFLLTGADTLHRYPPPGLPFALVNNYGPTEATVVATSGVVPAHTDGRPTIGRPIAGTEIYILDEQLRALPVGEVGELCIAGAGLARGYRNRPDLTAERFLPHPFTAAPGARLYRTGDRARWLPDGQLAFLGRFDDQLKIRGFRIEPDEIVATLDAQPDVQASAVAVRDDGAGDRRLIAYIVAASDAQPRPAVLLEALRARLPEYMLPAAFVQVAVLPLTANGKVDRAALPEPDAANTLRDDVVAPRTPVEERLALIVAQLLDVDTVGVNDNFFLLGGHSLLGTQLLARLRDAFGVDLPLRTVFDHPTVEGLAANVEQAILTRLEAQGGGAALAA